MSQATIIDPLRYREVMGHYPTGVAVVTGWSPAQEPVGMVVGTFTAVSLDPPLVAFMPTTTSGTYGQMKDSAAFCINVLAHDQLDICRTMAVPRPGKFEDVQWSSPAGGAPALDQAVAHIQCHTEEVVEAGDHFIVLCRVDDMAVPRPATPLLFFQGGYGGFHPKGMSARGDAALIAAIRLAERAEPQVELLARSLRCEAAVLVAAGEDELTTAVSAYGGQAEMTTPLGVRIPLIPPIGEAYVAWAGAQAQESWLARSVVRNEERLAAYRARLATVRADGYALTIVPDSDVELYAEMHQAMREWSDRDLTPARERAVRTMFAEAQNLFSGNAIDDNARYDVGSVVVPVPDPQGRPALILRLTQLPRNVPGATVREWVGALKHAARQVSEEIAGKGRPVYDAYLRDRPIHPTDDCRDFML